MSFAQFGYPVVSAPNMGPQATVTSRSSPKSPPGSPCCETGRPVMTDPMTGQTVCSCQYGPASAALYNYRVPGLPEALFNSAAMAAQLQQFAGADPSALYGGMASPYEFKGLPTAAGLYPYDPALAAYPYAAGFLDPNARRKNATRESTQTLKAWLTEHKKNPYPTKGEKIMLAIITKMTLTQVSTWFANARRRLKKENKMTWEPRNRMDEDDDDINSDIDENEKKDGEDENISVDSDDDDDIGQLHHNPLTASLALHHAQQLSSGAPLGLRPNFINAVTPHQMLLASSHQHPLQQQNSPVNTDSRTPDSNKSVPSPVKDNETKRESSTNATSPSESLNSSSKDSQRPKIWSMAEIATSSSKTNSESSVNSQSPHHHNKIPSIISQGLHPAWRGAHPYLHPHLAHRMAAFPIGQHPSQHIVAAGGQRPPILPAFASLPQLRHTDSANHVSAFSPPASATSPSTQAQRNV